MTRGGALIAALLVAASLGSCGDEPAPTPATRPVVPSALSELVGAAQRWAARAGLLLERGWAPRLEFRHRLYARTQALNAFVQEAKAAANDPSVTPDERLLERGRALVEKAPAFDRALLLLETSTPNLDQLTGYERLIELNMAPLETRGEAPYRLRVTDYGKQVAAGFSNLDLALRGILDQTADAKLFENIANKALSDALATATKLSEEVKNTSALAKGSQDRQRMLQERLAWAQGLAAKVKDLPADARQALDEAAKFAKDELDPATTQVIESLRNAQPDATQKARALAASLDAVIEKLTKAFLPVGRAAGVPDPVK
jgi:hypothetical protein